MPRAAFVVLLILCLGSLGLGNARAACPAPRQPAKLNVTTLLPHPPEDHDTAYLDLTKEMSRKMKPDEDALGVSSSAMGYRDQTEFQSVKRGGRLCSYLTALDFAYGYTHRLVQIAREIPVGSCLFTEVRKHEYKHVAVDTAIISDNLAYVTDRLQRFIAGYGPTESTDAAAAERQFDAAFGPEAQGIIDHLVDLREAAQAQVDTPAEYARVEDACRIHVDPTKTAAAPSPAAPTPPWHPDGK
jgi:hypothetical protein